MTRGVVLVRGELVPSRELLGLIDVPSGGDTAVCDLPATVTMTVTVAGSCRRPGPVVVVFRTLRRVGTAPPELTPQGTSDSGALVIDDHLVAYLDTADTAALEIADVIVWRDNRDIAATKALPTLAAWFPKTFARYPGCAVAVVADVDCGHLVCLRDGRMICFAPRLRSAQAAHRAGWDTVVACASLVHLWVSSDRRLDALYSVVVMVAVGRRLVCYEFTCHRPQPIR
jgi:hypothetical protein